MKIYVDIDNTICYYKIENVENDYSIAIPYKERIEYINKLYEDGNNIVYWTARGTVTKNDYYKLTLNQLKNWKCKFHSLSVGEKPAYDLLICDKTKRIEEI